MRVLVLGSLGVERSDGSVECVRGFQATLITELLAADSMVVSTDRLADALYGEDTPRSPLRAVHAHMTRSAKGVAPVGTRRTGRGTAVDQGGGVRPQGLVLESDAGQFLAELNPRAGTGPNGERRRRGDPRTRAAPGGGARCWRARRPARAAGAWRTAWRRPDARRPSDWPRPGWPLGHWRAGGHGVGGHAHGGPLRRGPGPPPHHGPVPVGQTA
ncbi:hypothetical protein ACRAWF_30595 [Streptomyces sp. L7]